MTVPASKGGESVEGDDHADCGDHRGLTGEEPRAERAQELGAELSELGVELAVDVVPEPPLGLSELMPQQVDLAVEVPELLAQVTTCDAFAPADRWQRTDQCGRPSGAQCFSNRVNS